MLHNPGKTFKIYQLAASVISSNVDPTTSTTIDILIMPSPLTIDINKLVTNDTMVDLSTSSDSFISPKQFRSFAKSGEKNSKRKERKKGCSMIATDTPERDRIEKRLCNKKLVKLTKELKAILQNINKKLLSGVARVSGAQGNAENWCPPEAGMRTKKNT